MTAPTWLNDTVSAFGRQMGLSSFALNERGAAGVRFENGISVRLEYAEDCLVMMAGIRAEPTDALVARLLTDAHASARGAGAFPVRAAYMARTGELFYAMRIDERAVDVSMLEGAFRELWTRAERLGRSAS